jgi:hypothetical protein
MKIDRCSTDKDNDHRKWKATDCELIDAEVMECSFDHGSLDGNKVLGQCGVKSDENLT